MRHDTLISRESFYFYFSLEGKTQKNYTFILLIHGSIKRMLARPGRHVNF